MVKKEYRRKYNYIVNWNCAYKLNKMLQSNGCMEDNIYMGKYLERSNRDYVEQSCFKYSFSLPKK